jgi:hypothetical protein
MAALALAACASVSKAVDDVRAFADHEPEAATYPNLADMPAKPTPPTNAAEHNAAVQSLQADQRDIDADAQKLRDDAAAMPPMQLPPKRGGTR